jgi:hypothetical protein
MERVDTVKELISLIEKRPLAFVSHRSLSELEAFINGYNYRKFAGELADIDKDYKEFVHSWIYFRLGIGVKQGWKEAIIGSCESETEAFEKFFDLWNEYSSQRTNKEERGGNDAEQR